MLSSSLLIFIQIVSESFPVSSSGHIALVACISVCYNLIDEAIVQLFFSSPSVMFFTHIPTIFILVFFFRTTWFPVIQNFWRYRRLIMHLILYTGIADSVTVLLYFTFFKKSFIVPLAIGFAITAAILFSLRWCHRSRTMLSVRHMILIGCVQGIALLPGISRLGIVYGTCRWLGVRSTKAFGVAWMVQWPLMIGGAFVSLVHPSSFTMVIEQPYFWSSTISASILAYGGLYCMYQCAQKNLVWLMSIYMLIPLVVALIMHC